MAPDTSRARVRAKDDGLRRGRTKICGGRRVDRQRLGRPMSASTALWRKHGSRIDVYVPFSDERGLSDVDRRDDLNLSCARAFHAGPCVTTLGRPVRSHLSAPMSWWGRHAGVGGPIRACFHLCTRVPLLTRVAPP